MKCASCGYDLRGANPSGNCPECATPVRTSAAIARVGWTPAMGLRRAALHLAIQGAAWTAGLVGAHVVIRPGLGWCARQGLALPGLFALLALAVIVGVVMARVFWVALQDKVGFSGVLVGIAAIISVIAVAATSSTVATVIGITSFQTGPVAIAIAGTVLVRVLHDVAVDG